MFVILQNVRVLFGILNDFVFNIRCLVIGINSILMCCYEHDFSLIIEIIANYYRFFIVNLYVLMLLFLRLLFDFYGIISTLA